MARYNFLASGYPITDEQLTRTSSTASKIGHDLFIATGFEIWTGAGKTGTKLTLTTDYSFSTENTVYTAKAGTTVYTKLAVVNGAYQNMALYLTYTTVGDLSNVENVIDIAHPIGDVIFQGPNDADPATLYPGTTWDDVSWEEANMTRRTAGALAGARFAGVPARLTVTVSGGVPTITVTSGGSGYLSGGSGTLALTIAGTCSTQMVATANVTSGVIVSITVNTAGVGYTSGAVAVYDGVAGHGDLAQKHRHPYSPGLRGSGTVGTGPYDVEDGPDTHRIGDPTSDGTNGTPRTGAETSGAWATVTKWRRTA